MKALLLKVSSKWICLQPAAAVLVVLPAGGEQKLSEGDLLYKNRADFIWSKNPTFPRLFAAASPFPTRRRRRVAARRRPASPAVDVGW